MNGGVDACRLLVESRANLAARSKHWSRCGRMFSAVSNSPSALQKWLHCPHSRRELQQARRCRVSQQHRGASMNCCLLCIFCMPLVKVSSTCFVFETLTAERAHEKIIPMDNICRAHARACSTACTRGTSVNFNHLKKDMAGIRGVDASFVFSGTRPVWNP